METNLISENITPAEIFKKNGLKPLVARIREEVAIFKSQDLDMNKKKDRDMVRSFANKIAKSKAFIDKCRVSFVKKRKDQLKIIDKEGKEFRDTLDDIKKDARKPLTAFEEAEKSRLEKEQLLKVFNEAFDEALVENNLFDREKLIAEREAEYARIEEEKREEREAIGEARRLKEEQEARDKEIRKEAAEAAEREKAEAIEHAKRIEMEKKEAIEFEKQKAYLAAKQAEIDKHAAIEEVKRKLAMESEAKKEEEIKQAAIVAKKAADKKHIRTVNNTVLKTLVKIGVDRELSIKIIKAISAKEIKHLSINY